MFKKPYEKYYKSLSSMTIMNDESTPQGYLYNYQGVLAPIDNDFRWKMMDFCRIHSIILNNVLHIERELDKKADEIKAFYKGRESEASELEVRDYYAFFDSCIAETDSNYQTYQFSCQLTVVGLWAIAEQMLGEIYKKLKFHVDGIAEEEVKIPYNFNKFKDNYNVLGIDLESLDTYDDANECRCLNNSIKHGVTISPDAEVAKFNYFHGYLNKKIIEIEFDLQRYVTGIVQFINHLIETANHRIDPNCDQH